jgi:cyclic beta-1,2-glucan synthetase
LFSIEQLKRHALTLAEQHRIDKRLGVDRLLPRLADNAQVLTSAYDVVSAAAALGQRIVPAEAWVLDNFYLIEQQIGMARRHLPRGYSRQLPRLIHGPQAGFPRIYDLALEMISHMDGHVADDNAMQFLAAYQSIEPLRLGELWAFPIMLQLALLENLRHVTQRIARRREDRDVAILWADRILAVADTEPKQLIKLLAEFVDADLPLSGPFMEEFYERLQSQGPFMAFIQSWVEQKLQDQGVTEAELSEAAGQISIANTIGSLRFIGTMDWKQFVETLSVVDQTLRDDPVQEYARQDFNTRDHYRHVIEDIARGSHFSEQAVAQGAITLARAAATRQGLLDRSAHVGYYLIDHGRQQLERAVGCRLLWKVRLNRAIHRVCLPMYLGAILLLTLSGTAVAVGSFYGLGAGDWYLGFLVLPLIIAASALGVSLVNLLVTLTLPPHVLPRMDFARGIPDSHRTMVVVPTLLGKAQDVDSLLEAMEIRYLGNRDPNLLFALLTDFHDAAQQTLPGDESLLEYARAAVEALNASYREDRECIFYLFHRPRLWNPFERVWMGYERKRGKLEQFNALLRGGALRMSFHCHDG